MASCSVSTMTEDTAATPQLLRNLENLRHRGFGLALRGLVIVGVARFLLGKQTAHRQQKSSTRPATTCGGVLV